MRLKKIIKMFENGNVCVCGMRGRGKDLLFGNVIKRRSLPYVSNLNYTEDANYNELDYDEIDMGKNTYKNFIENDLKFYEYLYPMGSDIYISDVGVYFPSQYCNELNRDYKYIPIYQALSRQVSHNNVHINVQNLNRAWDKLREQSDTYIYCNKCWYIKGFVFQIVTIYDKYDSCCQRVKPCRISVPLFADKLTKQNAQIYRDNFFNQHGNVKRRFLLYRNKSKHDTFKFEKKLKEGTKTQITT